MLSLKLVPKDQPLEILCLGAHCDDIEIGCAATILGLIRERSQISFTWVVFSSNEVRAAEVKNSFEHIFGGYCQAELKLHEFRNGYFPFIGDEIKD